MVGSKRHILWCLIFLGFLALTPFKLHQILNVGGVLKNSGNFQQDGHKNLQNCWRNVWDNWAQSWWPEKFQSAKFEPTLKFNIFWRWDFSTFFLIIWFKSTKIKFRPYFTMELVQKLMKKTSKYLFYSPLTEKVLTECPCSCGMTHKDSEHEPSSAATTVIHIPQTRYRYL